MAGSPTAAWLPKRPELAPANVSGPRFASPVMESGRPTQLGAQTGGRATRPFRFGSEDRPDPDPPLGVDSVIGDRYRILRLLGEGGMGRVYEAQHIVLRRRVALKLLRRDAGSESESLARFRQEALAASRIGAPEIVEVVDFASHPVAGGPQTYMVMELLAGESLEDWMDRNARLDEGLIILASLCDGLAAAHRAAVVHRDIKPANVFLPAADPTRSNQTRVKILDFGIAKITAGGEGFQTRQGALLGTPYYLAPERVMGAELTGAADVYSVGVILYEMLTGNVPFVADSFMGILANHVHTAPLDPRQAAPDRPIPTAVARLCMRLLDKQPGNRPSAEAVAAELRSVLARESGVLAAVAIGPRESAAADVNTQVLGVGTQALPIADRPTQPPMMVGHEPGSRSATRLGHAPAATHALSVTPVAAVAVPSKSGRGLAIALASVAAVAMIAAGAWLGLRGSDEPSEPSSAEAAIEPAIEPAVAVDPAPPIQPEPEAKPSEAVADPSPPSAPDPGASEAPAPEPAPLNERKHRESVAKRDRTQPKPESHDDPAPEPDVVPPQPEPSLPKPEPDPELPTIKDDVYD